MSLVKLVGAVSPAAFAENHLPDSDSLIGVPSSTELTAHVLAPR